MAATAWALLVIAGVFALGDWLARARSARGLEYVCKPAALLALVGVALTLHPTHGDARAWFVAALVLSLAGDVLLMLPSDQFVPGLASFLFAHVAYVVGLNLHDGSAGTLALAALPVAVYGVVLAARVLPAVRRRGKGALVAPLVAYLVVIGAMVASALATGSLLASAGAVLFLLSDSLIAETRFVREHAWAPVAIMVTYHLGQVGLVLSLVR